MRPKQPLAKAKMHAGRTQAASAEPAQQTAEPAQQSENLWRAANNYRKIALRSEPFQTVCYNPLRTAHMGRTGRISLKMYCTVRQTFTMTFFTKLYGPTDARTELTSCPYGCGVVHLGNRSYSVGSQADDIDNPYT